MSTQDSASATAKPTPGWVRWLSIAAGIVVAILALVKIINYVMDSTLPACDSKRARVTLYDVLKKKNVPVADATDIKTISSSKEKVECHATLSTADTTVDVSYKFVWDGWSQRIEAQYSTQPKIGKGDGSPH